MDYKIGRSAVKDPAKAVEEACSGLTAPKLIWFTSGVDAFAALTKALYARFPNSMIMGTTTFAAMCREGAFKDTLLVLGIEDGIVCAGDVLERADCCPLTDVERVIRCADQVGSVSGNDTICFSLSTGLIACEELVLSVLNSVLEPRGINVFGGTAGDRGRAEKTMVSFNGKVREKSCVFVILKNLGGPLHLYRENIYKQRGRSVLATKVDIRQRRVLEFDGRPAAEVEAEALGTTVAGLGSYLDSYPLGRIVGDEMYIVANQMVDPDQRSMRYHARIYDNSQIAFLEPADFRQINQQTIAKVQQEVPHPALSLMVNCLARSMLFESEGYLETFARDMGKALGNYVGFGGYGEQLRQEHFNQTMILAGIE